MPKSSIKDFKGKFRVCNCLLSQPDANKSLGQSITIKIIYTGGEEYHKQFLALEFLSTLPSIILCKRKHLQTSLWQEGFMLISPLNNKKSTPTRSPTIWVEVELIRKHFLNLRVSWDFKIQEDEKQEDRNNSRHSENLKKAGSRRWCEAQNLAMEVWSNEGSIWVWLNI